MAALCILGLVLSNYQNMMIKNDQYTDPSDVLLDLYADVLALFMVVESQDHVGSLPRRQMKNFCVRK